jgi:hypothetical protein
MANAPLTSRRTRHRATRATPLRVHNFSNEESFMLTMAGLRARLPGAVTLILVAAVVAAGVLAARSWLAAHDAAVHLAATLEAQSQILAQANERQRQRDATLATALEQIKTAKRRVDTPPKAAAEIPQVLPPLPEPVRLQIPPPTPQSPEPPAIATVPQTDLKPIYDYLQDCRACQASLAASRDDLADEHTKLAAVTAERDAAVRAAHGGGFWSRLKHNAKWFVIGAAAGALAAATTH